jgi:selenide,water dikinase
MVRSSDVDLTLAIDRIPLLEGARETVAMGIFSSLYPQNVRLRRAVRDLAAVSRHPLYPLLFDPQTAGGLLAGIPPENAERCVAALHAAGYAQARAIGFAARRSTALEPVTIDLDDSALALKLQRARTDARSQTAAPETAHAREAG